MSRSTPLPSCGRWVQLEIRVWPCSCTVPVIEGVARRDLLGPKLIKADTPDKHVATRFKKDCLSCHVPAQSTDWLCAQGYPVVKSK
jgi:hypothetical protein